MLAKLTSYIGPLMILGGIIILIGTVGSTLSPDNDNPLEMLIATIPFFLLVGLIGLYAYTPIGKLGKIGLGLGMVASLIMLVTMSAEIVGFVFIDDISWTIFLVSMLAIPVGLFIFGVAVWREKCWIRWNFLPMAIGFMAGPGTFLVEASEEVLGIPYYRQADYGLIIWGSAMGLGWMLLGYLLWSERKQGARRLASIVNALLGLGSLFLLVGCVQTVPVASGSEPKVFFTTPADGATVSSPIQVKMGAENWTIEPAGEIKAGFGHLHIMVDTACITAGQVIPNDETHLHYGKAQTEAELALTLGEHTLCLQAADGAHIALPGANMTDLIKVVVIK